METSFLTIAALSFAVALTGAMAPGPLLTYTIIQSAQSRQRGYLMGLWIIAGHAAIEAAIIVLLMAGFSFVLNSPPAVKVIGVAGGTMLVWFGISVIRDIYRRRLPGALNGKAKEVAPALEAKTPLRRRLLKNPVSGGALVSMANPYWWVWWATIGLAFMTEFEISFANPAGFAAFFLGHEAGDLAWYLVVSTLAFWGVQKLNPKVYAGMLTCCGLFMVGFGVYLGLSPFI